MKAADFLDGAELAATTGKQNAEAFLNAGAPAQPQTLANNPLAQRLGLADRTIEPGNQMIPGQIPPENRAMALATLGSMAAPEIAAPAWLARLGWAAPLAKPLVQNAARIPAAGLGGAAGGAMSEMQANPQATPGSVGQAALQSGKEMSLAELGGAYLGPVIQKLAAPGAAAMTGAGKNLLEFAKKYKVPLSPTEVSPSVAGKITEATLDNFVPSRMVNDLYRKKALTRFNQLMTEIPSEVGQVRGSEQISLDMMDALDKVLIGTEKAAKASRESFLATVGPKKSLSVPATIEALKNASANAVDPAVERFVLAKLNKLGRNKTMTAEDLETTLSQLSKVRSKGDEKFLEKIRTAIKKDFEMGGADMTKLDQSNELFRTKFGVLKGRTAKKLKADVAQGVEPTYLTENLFRDENSQLVAELEKQVTKGTLPKETWDALRAQNLANMIKNASRESPNYIGQMVIDGQKLERLIKTNQRMLKAVYKDSPGTLEALNNLATLAKASRSDVYKLEKGMGEAMKVQNLAGIVAGGYANLPAMVSAIGGSMALAQSLMKPNGLMKTWLTTGFKNAGKVGAEAGKFTVRNALSGGESGP